MKHYQQSVTGRGSSQKEPSSSRDIFQDDIDQYATTSHVKQAVSVEDTLSIDFDLEDDLDIGEGHGDVFGVELVKG